MVTMVFAKLVMTIVLEAVLDLDPNLALVVKTKRKNVIVLKNVPSQNMRIMAFANHVIGTVLVVRDQVHMIVIHVNTQKMILCV